MPPVRRWSILPSLLVVVSSVATSAVTAARLDAAEAHPVVAGFERFYSADDGDDAAGGLLLAGELNCTSCHAASAPAAALVLPKQAPILDRVGERVRLDYLRRFLADPQHTKPGTTMPSLFVGVDNERKQRQVESLVHLLASTGLILETGPITPAVQRGERQFHTLGCAACHDARQDGTQHLATSVPLPPDMEAKYSVPGLAAFLANPLAVRPSARMPHLNLTPEEARDVASYLLRELEVASTLEYAYYEGNWQSLPDFDRLAPKTTGSTNSFDVNVGRPDQFGVVFRGKFRVLRDGKYTFHLGSDDGSRLRIDGRGVVDVDGIHPLSFKSGEVELTAGLHDIQAEYFEQSGEQEMRIEFQGPGITRQAVEYVLVAPGKDDEAADDDRWQVDPALVAEGARLFESIGCAACHDLMHDGRRLPSRLAARSLAALAPDRGCLGAKINAPTPDFGLDSRQRAALGKALSKMQNVTDATPPLTAADVAQRSMTALNCYACHQRDGRGGVEPARNHVFLSNQPEMGDEGRLPPPLTGVGAKLAEAWLKRVVERGDKSRPYMFTRMPGFGAELAAPLVAALQSLDPPVAGEPVTIEIPAGRFEAGGRHLAGESGLSCVKCHTWGNVPATGIQAIDLTTMTQRLRHMWFQQYMLDPQRFRPGTRMPAAWPMGQVLLPQVLDGQALTQIEAIWEFLKDGRQAAMPLGLGPNPMPLVAYSEPILYRNFIEGAGTRAIGVGYPEKVNLAFDANDLRPALIWHNAFIDASKHWGGRGAGFQGPLGDNVLALPAGVDLAQLPRPAAAWPDKSAKELGYRFDGYRLDEMRRPTFLYRIGDVVVEDHFEPESKSEFTPLVRTLRFTGDATRPPLYFRAATAKSVEPLDAGWFRIDGTWKLHLESTATPEVRSNGGRREIIVPVPIGDGEAKIVQTFVW